MTVRQPITKPLVLARTLDGLRFRSSRVDEAMVTVLLYRSEMVMLSTALETHAAEERIKAKVTAKVMGSEPGAHGPSAGRHWDLTGGKRYRMRLTATEQEAADRREYERRLDTALWHHDPTMPFGLRKEFKDGPLDGLKPEVKPRAKVLATRATAIKDMIRGRPRPPTPPREPPEDPSVRAYNEAAAKRRPGALDSDHELLDGLMEDALEDEANIVHIHDPMPTPLVDERGRVWLPKDTTEATGPFFQFAKDDECWVFYGSMLNPDPPVDAVTPPSAVPVDPADLNLIYDSHGHAYQWDDEERGWHRRPACDLKRGGQLQGASQQPEQAASPTPSCSPGFGIDGSTPRTEPGNDPNAGAVGNDTGSKPTES